MKKQKYHVIGVMSGTSLDGVDLAECFLSQSEKEGWSFEIVRAETMPYASDWRMRLNDAVNFSEGRLHTLNEEYTHYLASVIRDFIDTYRITSLDLISSHGHTILHQPDKGLTLQIGNLPALAEGTGQLVVCDFRQQDVEMGGQGAPLVPVGDRLLFAEYDACINIGGFANVSFESGEGRIAYDICPVNTVLNYYAAKLGEEYDRDGLLARSGTLNKDVLKSLNKLEYYKKPPPKSLGVEYVNEYILPILEGSGLNDISKLRTYCEHVAFQLSEQIDDTARVLFTGGGVNNKFLIERVLFYNSAEIVIPDARIVEYKEALIFALLGVLKLRGENNCLSSVTGSARDHSSGKIYEIK
ncbi:MAG: anhydro-N-acetylmuramic acid kinase [Flavobacterium sp.]|nr:MAG: anhydro-N-acetylmuramic acid kinase [Flavobacterium sp.]